MVKMMPSLENGIEVVGFLKQMDFKDEDEPVYLLYLILVLYLISPANVLNIRSKLKLQFKVWYAWKICVRKF
jgi:hypothetical protein